MNPASYRSVEQLCFYCACIKQLRRLFLLRSCPQTSTATLTPPSLTPALASHSTSTLSSWFHGELFELRTLIWTVVWQVLYIKVTSCDWWRQNRTSSHEYDIIPALSARCVSAGTTTSSATATVCATWSCTCSARSKKSCHGFLVPSHDSLFSVTVWIGCRNIRPREQTLLQQTLADRKTQIIMMIKYLFIWWSHICSVLNGRVALHMHSASFALNKVLSLWKTTKWLCVLISLDRRHVFYFEWAQMKLSSRCLFIFFSY